MDIALSEELYLKGGLAVWKAVLWLEVEFPGPVKELNTDLLFFFPMSALNESFSLMATM